jgi:hypothetical protein
VQVVLRQVHTTAAELVALVALADPMMVIVVDRVLAVVLVDIQVTEVLVVELLLELQVQQQVVLDPVEVAEVAEVVTVVMKLLLVAVV